MSIERTAASATEPFASVLRFWEWQEAAACSGTDTDLFFGGEHETAVRRTSREARARAMCAGCPVRLKCLEFALNHRIQYGVWGGVNESDRAAILRRLRRRRIAASHIDDSKNLSSISAEANVAAG